MHKRDKGHSRRRTAVLLGLCLMISLLWNVTTVYAVDLNTTNRLTVTAVETESKYSTDIAGAGLVFDLYQLAGALPVDGVDTYSYSFLAPYDQITIDGIALSQINLNGVSLSAEQWKDLGKQAAQKALESGSYTRAELGEGAISATFPNLAPGLYLVLAHGKDLTPYSKTEKNDKGEDSLVTIAESACYEYTFTPAVVSLPTKEAQLDGDGIPVINTAQSFGDWIYDATVYLKSDKKPLYGGVKITKTIDRFEDAESATFVFRITAIGSFPDKEQYEYKNVAAITFDASTGLSNTAIVDHIRAGANVTVEEIYSGPRYEKGAVVAPASTIVVAEEGNEISFTASNTRNDSENGGHGIQNHYENVENNQNADTHWVGPADQEGGQK